MPLTIRPVLWLMSLSLLFSPFMETVISANEAPPAPAVETSAYTDPVKVQLINEEASIKPGQPFFVAVQLQIEDKWHAYWKNPGEAGMPPAVVWNLPEGFEVGPLIWPTPIRLGSDKGIKLGYEGTLTLLAEITAPESYEEKQATIAADVRWVVCSDTSCLPGDNEATLNLPVSSNKPEKTAEHQVIFTQARALAPKKHDAITVVRNNGLLEIAFNSASTEKKEITHVEFYSEHQKAIDLNGDSYLQNPSNDSKTYTLVVKEISVQDSIKGILVVHTANGTEAYDIDAPIASHSSSHKDSLISMSHSVGVNSASEGPKTSNSFEFEGGVALAILFAFIGGMILNLMPCVLPVISFKVLGFIKLAGQSRKLIFQHGVAFSFGVLLSFWVLAAALLILQAYGRSVGWGFQLQEPLFVAILAALLFIFGLSLFGVFEVGNSIMAAAGDAQQKTNKRNQLLSSFFSGVLATAVATPCTGPFLGSAIGFAFTLPPLQAMLIFTSLGLGMSSPYLALAAFPALLRFLPKPGPWMITFKELMGFLMMASVLWLTWVFSAQTSTFSVSLLLAGFFLFAVACWIYGRWATPLTKKLTRTIGTFATLLFLGMGSYALIASTSDWAEKMGGTTTTKTVRSDTVDGTEIADADVWEKFSPERVAELRKQGIPVFIDFTAKWCLICQTNHMVLSGDDIAGKFNQRGIVKMKADWTKKDEMIAGELRKFGRNSVPLYVLYGGEPESTPKILPQVLTTDAVMESLNGI